MFFKQLNVNEFLEQKINFVIVATFCLKTIQHLKRKIRTALEIYCNEFGSSDLDFSRLVLSGSNSKAAAWTHAYAIAKPQHVHAHPL